LHCQPCSQRTVKHDYLVLHQESSNAQAISMNDSLSEEGWNCKLYSKLDL